MSVKLHSSFSTPTTPSDHRPLPLSPEARYDSSLDNLPTALSHRSSPHVKSFRRGRTSRQTDIVSPEESPGTWWGPRSSSRRRFPYSYSVSYPSLRVVTPLNLWMTYSPVYLRLQHSILTLRFRYRFFKFYYPRLLHFRVHGPGSNQIIEVFVVSGSKEGGKISMGRNLYAGSFRQG